MYSFRAPRSVWLALLWGLASTPAAAGKIYKIVNPDGTVHYTDRRPEALDDVEIIKTRAEPQRIAQLQIERDGPKRRAVARNMIDGPIEIELRFRSATNVLAQPALPLRVVVPAAGSQTVAEFAAADGRLAYSFELEMSSVPGAPVAKPEDFAYLLPVEGDAWRIDQGWNGSFSHRDPQSQYAVDLNVAEGTPIRAARAGRVMQVEDDFEGAGLSLEKFAGRANHVRIVHDDGTMAVYAHLAADSVVVRSGARVRQGQRIGLSGNTGYSTGPHLHFAVQANRGMALASIPFRFAGEVRIPGR